VETISRKEIALITGEEPSRTYRYKLMGKVVSEPTRKSVVLKFSKLIKKATAPAPIRAGRRKGMVI